MGVIAVKTIVRRPTLHYVIMAAYVLAPLGNVVLVSIFGGIPISTVLERLMTGYGRLATIWLVTAPIVGLSLFLVNRVTWYLFIAHSSLILVDFVYKWVDRPEFYFQTVGGLLNSLLFLGNLGLVAMVLYIIQRDFRSPYFQVLQRSFREARRVPIEHTIRINDTTARINDLSSGGCFVAAPELALSTEGRVTLELRAGNLDIHCQGRVMRQTSDGYGLMFVGLKQSDRKALHRLIRQRFELRYLLDFPALWLVVSESREVSIVNMSAGGCYVATDDSTVAEGQPVTLAIRIGAHAHQVTGKIAWTNPTGEFGKQAGFGVMFHRHHKRLLRLALDHKGRQQLTR